MDLNWRTPLFCREFNYIGEHFLMKLQFKVLNTLQLSQAEWTLINQGFNESFSLCYTIERMREYYTSSEKGYSYHVLAFSEGAFLGSTSVFPYTYLDRGAEFQAGISGGSFILPHARTNPMVYQQTYNALREHCKTEGLSCIIGIPNENLFRYSTKVMPFTYLFDLPFFVFPASLKPISKMLNRLSPLWRLCASGWMLVMQAVAVAFNSREAPRRFRLDTSRGFYERRFANGYSCLQIRGCTSYYKTVRENELDITYIFEFSGTKGRDFRNLVRIVHHVLRREKSDVIAFVGTLSMRQGVLFRLPQRRAPRRLPFTIDVLDPARRDSMLVAGNWDFGLMNFDAR
jgi:hypothetical protein